MAIIVIILKIQSMKPSQISGTYCPEVHRILFSRILIADDDGKDATPILIRFMLDYINK